MIHQFGKLVFIDLESTGPDPLRDRITEIGLVAVSAEGVRRWSALVNPQVPIPPFITGLTGISDEMVRAAPTFELLQDELLRHLDGGLFIAHNARFDYGFLRNEFRRLGKTFRSEVLCTVKLSRRLFPLELRHSLDALIERHGLVADARHRALADAELLWQYWRVLEESVARDTLAGAVQHLLQRPNLPVHLDADLLDDIPDTPGVYVFRAQDDMPLFVGRAAHLRQRVLSHFHGERPSQRDVRLAHDTHRVDWHETAGEVGAQLLEARLIRQLRPPGTEGRPDERQACSWRLAAGDGAPLLAHADEEGFGRGAPLHGLFTSRAKAEAALRALAQKEGLCLALLGLETREPATPCSARAAGQCRGACIGREPAAAHAGRLAHALASLPRINWTWDGPVGLLETRADGRTDVHLVDNWCWLGTSDAEGVRRLLARAPARPAFEVDTYRIASRALESGKVEMRPLARH
ncbi:MAG TPA: exonuclease domain-containing protein [Noviherbaspirillum sp.]|uniref:3'-5' exonuclease family protein n=1 Tax=Noviherbaspirillum sp. TaxID=1926288 RepID=UPI002D5C2598|nr:exonuclease domain-containing protein [Noviherbaspirillum sp.]HYD94835.1 exonuclease domain-containing protein [Noviherbaspirillum sp.]